MLRALSLTALFLLLAAGLAPGEPKPLRGPEYNADGELLRPRGWRSWVVAGTSLGLGYSAGSRSDGPGPFRSVYIQPEAARAYQETGEFPEGTMLALVVHGVGSREPIAQNGFYQGAFERFELAVKDSKRNPDVWAYYDFGKAGELKETSTPFAKDRCWSCHDLHGADDNVFVQFYPVLRDPVDDR